MELRPLDLEVTHPRQTPPLRLSLVPWSLPLCVVAWRLSLDGVWIVFVMHCRKFELPSMGSRAQVSVAMWVKLSGRGVKPANPSGSSGPLSPPWNRPKHLPELLEVDRAPHRCQQVHSKPLPPHLAAHPFQELRTTPLESLHELTLAIPLLQEIHLAELFGGRLQARDHRHIR